MLLGKRTTLPNGEETKKPSFNQRQPVARKMATAPRMVQNPLLSSSNNNIMQNLLKKAKSRLAENESFQPDDTLQEVTPIEHSKLLGGDSLEGIVNDQSAGQNDSIGQNDITAFFEQLLEEEAANYLLLSEKGSEEDIDTKHMDPLDIVSSNKPIQENTRSVVKSALEQLISNKPQQVKEENDLGLEVKNVMAEIRKFEERFEKEIGNALNSPPKTNRLEDFVNKRSVNKTSKTQPQKINSQSVPTKQPVAEKASPSAMEPNKMNSKLSKLAPQPVVKRIEYPQPKLSEKKQETKVQKPLPLQKHGYKRLAENQTHDFGVSASNSMRPEMNNESKSPKKLPKKNTPLKKNHAENEKEEKKSAKVSITKKSMERGREKIISELTPEKTTEPSKNLQLAKLPDRFKYVKFPVFPEDKLIVENYKNRSKSLTLSTVVQQGSFEATVNASDFRSIHDYELVMNAKKLISKEKSLGEREHNKMYNDCLTEFLTFLIYPLIGANAGETCYCGSSVCKRHYPHVNPL